jgi:hypothetical protein
MCRRVDRKKQEVASGTSPAERPRLAPHWVYYS